MLQLRSNGNLLEQEQDGQWITFARLPDRIQQWESTADDLVVVLTSQTGENTDKRNLFLLNSNGQILWQIEKAEPYPDPYYILENTYCGFVFKNGKLIAFSVRSFDYEVDLKTGKITRIGYSF